MNTFTIFTCIGPITPTLQKICDEKQIFVFDSNVKRYGWYGPVNNVPVIAFNLMQHKNVFVSNAEKYIDANMNFNLKYDVYKNTCFIKKITVDCILVLEKQINEYEGINDDHIKCLKAGSQNMNFTEFTSLELSRVIVINDKEDLERIKAITPCFESHNLRDIIPLVYIELKNIRSVEQNKSKINNWDITFDSSFNKLTEDEQYVLLRKVEKKYHDFDQIIERTSNNMKSEFKMYAGGTPYSLDLKHMTFDNGKLRFKIIVNEEGKKSTYHLSAGGFFVPW